MTTMGNDQKHLITNRICIWCNGPLEPNEHGNRKAHTKCAYEHKKQSQKEKFKVGNSAKLKIQKNETAAAILYKMDHQKCGVPYLTAIQYGLNFDCPTIIREHSNKQVFFFDNYGYSIETVKGSTLIFIFHESDLH